MSTIKNGEFVRDTALGKNSMGGTELTAIHLVEELKKEIGDKLNEFHIVVGRLNYNEKLPEDKIRILWMHDLPGDPESEFLKDADQVEKFHKIIFVSNWQMQAYIKYYNLPWSKCLVLHNAITPISRELINKPDPKEEIRLIYHSTPHRGLNILTAVFDELCKKYDNIRLDVYSSFKLYGWGARDVEFKEVYEKLEQNPHAHNHGTVSHDEIIEAVGKAHIFAFPSIWPETSCRCLIEAMSAETICVHSNYGALPETSANWNQMYQYNENINQHASMLYSILDGVISNIDIMQQRTATIKSYTDTFYGWPTRRKEWSSLFISMLNSISDRSIPEKKFKIKTA